MINTLIILIVIILLWSAWGFFGSNVERADYIVEKKMKGYEIRKYPARIVAQTKIPGSYSESMSEGFGIIAGYIFGGNTKKESISMTAPVVASTKTSENIAMTAPVVATADGDFHVISFGMPRSYTLETLPKPNDSRVEILTIPEKRYGVMRFSWYRSDAQIKRTQEKLLLALARDGIMVTGNTAYAGYNAPWTPPWMIRNEILVEIK
jgi:effector-binding domain-containing protein